MKTGREEGEKQIKIVVTVMAVMAEKVEWLVNRMEQSVGNGEQQENREEGEVDGRPKSYASTVGAYNLAGQLQRPKAQCGYSGGKNDG